MTRITIYYTAAKQKRQILHLNDFSSPATLQVCFQQVCFLICRYARFKRSL